MDNDISYFHGVFLCFEFSSLTTICFWRLHFMAPNFPSTDVVKGKKPNFCSLVCLPFWMNFQRRMSKECCPSLEMDC